MSHSKTRSLVVDSINADPVLLEPTIEASGSGFNHWNHETEADRVRVEAFIGEPNLYIAVLHSLPNYQLEASLPNTPLDEQCKTAFWLETELGLVAT